LLSFSTGGLSTFDLLILGYDFFLSLQLRVLDSCTASKDRLLYVLGSRLCGRVHPENARELSDLLNFLLARTTFGRVTEVYDKSLSRRIDAKVRKSDIAVKDVRRMD
jgi:hypothetical protein